MKYNVPFTIEYKIKEVKKDDFAKIKINKCSQEFDSSDAFAKGNFLSAYNGDTFEAEGVFVQSDRYGFIVKLTSTPKLIIPQEKTALCKYMASQIVGVSAKLIGRVYDFFGGDFISIVNENPEELKKIKMKDSQYDGIIDWCKNHFVYGNVIGELLTMHLSPEEAVEVFKTYGNDSLREIKKDTYSLLYKGILSFEKCDYIFLNKLGEKNDDIRRSKAVLYDYLIKMQNIGNMAVLLSETIENLNNYQHNVIFDNTRLLNCIRELKGKIIVKEFTNNKYLALTENYLAEEKIARYLSRKDFWEPKFNETEIEHLLTETTLKAMQKKAVIKCLTNKVSVITGGPGTGKTFTINEMIKVAKKINPRITIALMAPTGKAASRMIEMIGEEATTIHAKLGLSENDDLNEEDGMVIDEDIVVIDEVSMMEEKLFAYLTKHISVHSQIILVGDSGQLPSIGAGNLLEELIKSVPTTELDVSKRSEAYNLNQNARWIRKNKPEKVVFDPKCFDFDDYENIIDAVIEEYIYTTAKKERPLILAAQHTPFGVDEINKKIQDLNDGEAKEFDNKKFKIGDRVMCTKNCNKIDIHNGDQGEIIAFTKKGLEILFDGKDDSIEITDLNIICLSYCITVHKSQGSEAKIVFMVFPKQHENMLTKKLIYTAITRSKEKFVGFGSKDVFFKGCKKDEAPRISLITKILKTIPA